MWFGLVSEVGFPGLLLFLALIVRVFIACRTTRRALSGDSGRPPLAVYASALETSFIVFIVGGSFLNAQYSELVWHLICVSVVLESVATALPSELPGVRGESGGITASAFT